MIDDTRLVFGISPGVRDSEQYVFVDVLGEVIDGKLKAVRQPKYEFPNVGNVYLRSEHWIPPVGVGAIWRVRKTRTAEPGARMAEYSVVERGRPLPLEIIALAASEESPEEVRQALIEGVSLSYTPASTVLVQLAGGCIIGPVRCEPMPDGPGFRCTGESLYNMLSCWTNSATLDPITFYVRGDQRTFTSLIRRPAPESYYDCSDMEQAVRSILRLAREALGSDADITKRQIDSLARAVAELSVPAKLNVRLARVKDALSAGRLGHIQLKELASYFAEHPSVQAELAAIREEVRRTERDRFAQEEEALTRRIAELRSTKASLEDTVNECQAKAANAERDLTNMVNQAAEKIRHRIDELQAAPAEMLANIALLRPFLSYGGRMSEISTGLVHRRLARPSEIDNLSASSDLIVCLERNLGVAGLLGSSAKQLAREIAAATLAGQMVLFSGSLARTLAVASARAFAGESASYVRVPVGLLESEGISTAITTVRRDMTSTATVAALLLEGVNRSAFEAYGDDLRSLVSERQLSRATRASGLVLFGTLVHGPSTLSLSPSYCELGPILDTDTLTIRSRPATTAPVGGRISQSDWNAWRSVAWNQTNAEPDSHTLIHSMEGQESMLWRQCVRNAFKNLTVLMDESTSCLQSLAFGWLIPRAHSCGLAREAFLDELRELTSAANRADPRLKKLLVKLFKAELHE